MRRIGKYTYGHNEITFLTFGDIEETDLDIGSFTSIAQGCKIYSTQGKGHYPYSGTNYPFGEFFRERFNLNVDANKYERNPIKIGNDVWIGADVSIKAGVTIGDGAVIATRSHVIKDVEPYSIVGGNPAKFIRYRFDKEYIDQFLELKWWDMPDAHIQAILPLLRIPPEPDIFKYIYSVLETLNTNYTKRKEAGVKMDCEEIKTCIACGSDELVPVLDLGFQPLANNYKKNKNDPEQSFPLAINRCKHCYHVQLTHKVNPELMFTDYAYVSGTAKTQLEYFDWFVDYIVGKYGSTPSSVLDIGCNDGSFLNAWGGTGTKTFGVDPAENLHPISSKNHSVHCGFFTGKEFPNQKFDVITCMNAFAHNADQLELLKNIKQIMHGDSLLFCTTSQADMILNGEFDTIYHEHLSFYNIKSADALCKRAGLNLLDVYKHPIHGNSYIFVISATKTDVDGIRSLIEVEDHKGLYTPDTYAIYTRDCNMAAIKFRNVILDYKEKGIPVVGFGAAAKGNTLMNFAEQAPDFIIDDNPLKQGLYTPGLGCPIVSADELKKYESVDTLCFVPLAWNFYDEIVNRIKTLRPGKKDVFVRYFPKFEINEG